MRMKTFAAMTFGVALASLAVAHEAATGVVRDRMERMERFEELIERVFAMMHGELAHDGRAVRSAAQEIRDGAGAHLTELFPAGSGGAPSEASDEIWRDPETFAHWARMLEAWSGELAARADQRPRGRLPLDWEDAEMGPGMMRGGMMSGGPVAAAWHVAAACNACHDRFREAD